MPEGLTVADLSRNPHPSKLRNPLLASAFYFAKIVERWGSGTLRMANECLAHGLPAPEFAQIGSEFQVTFRKDPYTEERLKSLGVSDRQVRAVRFIQEKGSISNSEYRELVGVKDRTALADLSDLLKRDIFVKPTQKGSGARFTLRNPQNPQ